SAILPRYARRSKSLEVLIPILYLKGISTGDFEEALIALLGKDAGGLSASTVGRLKEAWSEEYGRWSKRDLSAKRYVYFWVDGIVEAWGIKYDKAVECLIKDRGALLAFYDFPAEHWKHLRTTNVIESSFATVRHRTVRSKGCLSNKTALAMIFKLAEAAEKSWRRLNGHNQLPKIILGIKFTDGIEVVRSQAQIVAA